MGVMGRCLGMWVYPLHRQRVRVVLLLRTSTPCKVAVGEGTIPHMGPYAPM